MQNPESLACKEVCVSKTSETREEMNANANGVVIGHVEVCV